jgi:hypothetical protein
LPYKARSELRNILSMTFTINPQAETHWNKCLSCESVEESRGLSLTAIVTLLEVHWPSDKCPLFAWYVESSWNVTAHGDAREGKWRGNWRMEWVVSTLHTTSEHVVSSITTADAHTSAASSRLNWRPPPI